MSPALLESKSKMNPSPRLLSVLAAGMALLAAMSASAQQGLKARTFRFTYKTTLRDVPAGAKSLDVWLPYPQTDVNQTLRQVTIQAPGTVTIGREPVYGNEALFYPPGQSEGTGGADPGYHRDPPRKCR